MFVSSLLRPFMQLPTLASEMLAFKVVQSNKSWHHLLKLRQSLLKPELKPEIQRQELTQYIGARRTVRRNLFKKRQLCLKHARSMCQSCGNITNRTTHLKADVCDRPRETNLWKSSLHVFMSNKLGPKRRGALKIPSPCIPAVETAPLFSASFQKSMCSCIPRPNAFLNFLQTLHVIYIQYIIGKIIAYLYSTSTCVLDTSLHLSFSVNHVVPAAAPRPGTTP